MATRTVLATRQVKVRLRGEVLDTATLTSYVDEDGDGYAVEGEDFEGDYGDASDARYALADGIRGARNARMEEEQDAAKDEAQTLLDDLLDSGRALDVIKLLRSL